jgi:hypothetical protein
VLAYSAVTTRRLPGLELRKSAHSSASQLNTSIRDVHASLLQNHDGCGEPCADISSSSTPCCSISFEPFMHDGANQPVFLPDCGHTYSRKTVELLFVFTQHPFIQCPVCQTKQLSLRSADEAKPNWYAIQQLPDPKLHPPSRASSSSGSFLFKQAKYVLSTLSIIAAISYLFLGNPLLLPVAFLKASRIIAAKLAFSRRPAVALLLKLCGYLLSSPFSSFFVLLLATPLAIWALAYLRASR